MTQEATIVFFSLRFGLNKKQRGGWERRYVIAQFPNYPEVEAIGEEWGRGEKKTGGDRRREG